MFIGFLILLIGILMLPDRLGVIHGDFWDYFWPEKREFHCNVCP